MPQGGQLLRHQSLPSLRSGRPHELKALRKSPRSRPVSSARLTKLRAQLAVAEETLRAIRAGEVDTMVVASKQGDRVFTLDGAERTYRVLIESMNEGAVTVTSDKTILYANQCFARMVRSPLEQVIGSSFRRFLSVGDRSTLRPLMQHAARSGSKIQMSLQAADGSLLPTQISIRKLPDDGSGHETIGMVVADMTEARRIEELLRALTHRVVQVQEAERGRLALELHDHITQLLCAVLLRSQALASSLSTRNGPAKREAMQLRRMLARTAGEVERISRRLRPGALAHLELADVLRAGGKEFAQRTGVPVGFNSTPLNAPLPADTELALYRIFEEALKNVEQHARARRVEVKLNQQGAFVLLTIDDDGVGFDHAKPTGRKAKRGLGLLGMRERAAYVGGVVTISSGRRAGTAIEVRVPFPARAPAAA